MTVSGIGIGIRYRHFYRIGNWDRQIFGTNRSLLILYLQSSSSGIPGYFKWTLHNLQMIKYWIHGNLTNGKQRFKFVTLGKMTFVYIWSKSSLASTIFYLFWKKYIWIIYTANGRMAGWDKAWLYFDLFQIGRWLVYIKILVIKDQNLVRA